jgi:gliding motility-associated-like protein
MSLILTLNLVAQGCYNADFELGNFTGWQGRRGDCCPITLSNNGIANGRQTIMSTGIDPNTCGGLSTVYSGNFSARLGNDNVGAQAEGLTFTFNVTPQSTLVQYAYAVVFEDPGHTDDEQPRFNSRVRLSDGSIISCTDYMVTAASNLPGFQSCPGIDSQGDPVNIAWRDWSTVTVDLSAYIGQTVTLEFETGDCSLGGHFGYAYIDAIYCTSTEIDVQYCINQTTATLSAPPGFSTYLWETGETTQTISVNPALYDSLSCFITTITGCELTLTTALQPTVPTPSFTYIGECQGIFNFTNATTITNNGQGTYLWNFGDGTTSTLSNPSHTYLTPGSYTVTLYVITDNGCDAEISQNIDVYPLPVANYFVNDNCFGSTTIFINNTSQIPGYNLEYYWSFGNNTGSTIFSPSYNYSTPGTYNTNLIVTVSGTNCKDTISDILNIRSNPISDFTIQNSCQGIPTQFINNSQVPNWSTSNQYLWNFDEFGATSLLQSPTYTYSTEGTFNPSLIITSTDGTLSCSTQVNEQVVIYPNPGVSFLAQNNSCIEDTVQFTNLSTISPTSQIINYVWNFGDGQNSNLSNPSHIYNSTGVFNITLTATSNFGCVRNSQNQIIINSLPNITSTNNSMCQGQLANLVAQGGIFYSWSPSNTLINSNSSVTTSNANQTTIYTVTGTDINGCSNISQSILTVNPLPQIIVNGGEICEGNSVQLNAFGANTYTWSPSIGLSNNIGQFVISTPISSITYNVTGIDINGCSNTSTSTVIVNQNPNVSVTNGFTCEETPIVINASGADNYTWSPSLYLNTNIGSQVISNPNSNIGYMIIGINNNGCIDTAYSYITVYPLSDVSFLPTDGSGCPPLSIQFEDLSTGNISSWFWNFGDGSYSTEQNPEHQYETSGIYQVTLQVTTFEGCQSSSPIPNIVNVYPEPTSYFILNPDIVDEYNPVVSFTNYSVNAINYFWDFDDNTYSNLVNPEHTFPNAGDYIIMLTAENQFGCLDTSYNRVRVNPFFTFYIPNAFTPSNDQKNELFYGKGTNYKSVTMQIFNRWGEKIFDKTGTEPPIWDGTLNGIDCQIDVYVYQFFVTDIFDEVHVYRGRVTLVR